MKLTHDMGNIDRWARGLIIGPGAIIAAVMTGAGSILGIVLIAVGVIMLATAVVGMCPLYTVLGIDTHRSDRKALGA